VSITLIALILLVLMAFLLMMGIWIPAGVAITAWFGLAFFSDKDTMMSQCLVEFKLVLYLGLFALICLDGGNPI